MAGLNKVMVIGNLGKDPEMRYTPNGKPVTSFSVAVSRRFSSEGGDSREETIWFRISAWNTLADAAISIWPRDAASSSRVESRRRESGPAMTVSRAPSSTLRRVMWSSWIPVVKKAAERLRWLAPAASRVDVGAMI